MGLIVVVLYAYLAIPAIVQAVSSASVSSIGAGCGPAAELGQAAAYAMAAIAAVRMALAAFNALLSAMSGTGSGMSRDDRCRGDSCGHGVGQRCCSSCGCIFGSLLGEQAMDVWIDRVRRPFQATVEI